MKCWVGDSVFFFFIAVFRKWYLAFYLRGEKWNFMLFFDLKKVGRSDENTLRICDAVLITYYKRNFNSDVPYWSFTN